MSVRVASFIADRRRRAKQSGKDLGAADSLSKNVTANQIITSSNQIITLNRLAPDTYDNY